VQGKYHDYQFKDNACCLSELFIEKKHTPGS
jgi:hypothetical protein